LAFARQTADECVVVAVNAADEPVPIELTLPASGGERLFDLLNPGESFPVFEGRVRIDAVWPCWARIMVVT
jgi:hypothetical protein